MRKGVFVAIEGGDGAGKTSVINILKDIYTKKPYTAVSVNYPTKFLRAPGGCPVGERIRELFLDNNTVLDPVSELALMLANHRENYLQIIKPVIDNGGVVFCDRYVATTFAYQAIGRGKLIEYNTLKPVILSSDMLPDLTVLVDAPEIIRFKRIAQRGGLDRMDSTDVEFKRAVDSGFKQRYNDFTIVNDGEDGVDSEELRNKCNKLVTVIDSMMVAKQ